jgi:hypothetical protein
MSTPRVPVLSAGQIRDYREHGFLLIKGVFSAEEVHAFQAAMDEGGASAVIPCFRSPRLHRLWADPRLTGVAGQLLGDMAFFEGQAIARQSPMKPGETVLGRHLHHDAKGTPGNIFNRLHAPQTEPYPVLRFGIYPHDYARQSGGLKVVPGSHLTDSSAGAPIGQCYNVPSEPGDLVVFCLKTLHSPYALRFKDNPERAISTEEEDQVVAQRPELFLDAPARRSSIFLNYGTTAEFSDLSMKNRALKTYNVYAGYASYLVDGPDRSGSIPVRVDEALVETAATAASGDKAARARLPKICALHFETSAHYPLWDSEIPERSEEILEVLIPRLQKYMHDAETMTRDHHMNAFSPKHHQLFAQKRAAV